MKRLVLLFTICTTIGILSSCNKALITPYDNPFFYIHVNNASQVNVQATRNETVDYKVYLSSKLQYDPIALNYEIIVGNGLKAGVDFELVNTSTTLVFKPGYFEMPVSIKWKSNPLDATKDNSITIKLLDNDKGITVGLPGPDKKQTSLKITKI